MSRSLACLACAAVSAAAVADPAKLDPSLSEARGGSVPVVVFLSKQHMAAAMAAVSAGHQPLVDDAKEDLRQAVLRVRGLPDTRESQEESTLTGRVEFDQAFLAPMVARIDRARTNMVDAALRQALSGAVWDFGTVRSLVARVGGKFTGATLAVSTVSAVVPRSALKTLAASPHVSLIAFDREGVPELNTSAVSFGADAFWNQGFTGGAFDVGVLDTGVYQAHPAFAGRRFESNAGTGDSGGHGTMVAGIMTSNNATYRGMAPGLDTISVAVAGGDSTSMSGMNYLMTGVTERAENVNYSFGNGTANSQDYASIDRFFDGVCDTFQVMVSKSTGNGGFSSGAPTITHPAPAYNLLACASIFDQGNTNRADDRISSYSSTGPTVGGRKKPDIASPGESITTTNNTGGFSSNSGTSFAAPHIGGSVVLLNNVGAPGALAAKAVLINTADAIDSRGTSSTADDLPVAGSFWDRRYGWGYANLNRAFVHAPDVFLADLQAPATGSRTFKLFKGQMFANDKATATWNRHVAFNGAAYPSVVRALSDLNLFAFNQSTGAQTAASASTVDNVEQISVGADALTVLKVATNGTFDPAVATERFALATPENFAVAAGPVATATFSRTLAATFTSPFDWTVRVRNSGDLPMFGVTVEMRNFGLVSGTNPVSIGTVQPGQAVDVVFRVRRTIQGTLRLPEAVVRSDSYGESWSWILVDPQP
jgi:serine protease AprX